MVQTNLQLEKLYKKLIAHPPRKDEETLTSFNKSVLWYNRNELARQTSRKTTKNLGRITYEDHRKAIETAVHTMHKNTQHDIAVCILTDKFFKDYRTKVFAGKGSFTLDYDFLIVKINILFNTATGCINSINILPKLQSYTEPTLAQINYISGTVTKVTIPSNKFTLNEWAIKYNKNAVESTSYRLLGTKNNH